MRHDRRGDPRPLASSRPSPLLRARVPRTTLRTALRAVLLLGTVGSSAVTAPTRAGAQVEPGSEVGEALADRRSAFERAIAANDVDGMVSLYTTDALLFPPAGDTIRGRAAIRNEFDHPRDYTITHEVVELTRLGEAVHELGRWRLIGKDEGAVRDGGWYSWIWVRRSDGAWRVARDLWSDGLPGG